MQTASLEPTDLSDADLCSLVRRGDGVAADALVRRYTPLVRRVVDRYRPPARVDRDDLIQVGMIGVYRAARYWEPDGRSKFSTYAWHVADRAVRAELGRQLDDPLPVDPIPRDDEGLDRVRIDLIPARDSAERPDLAQLLAGLSPAQRVLVAAYYGLDGRHEATRSDRRFDPEGFPWGRTASEFGVSIHQAKVILSRAVAAARVAARQLGLAPGA